MELNVDSGDDRCNGDELAQPWNDRWICSRRWNHRAPYRSVTGRHMRVIDAFVGLGAGIGYCNSASAAGRRVGSPPAAHSCIDSSNGRPEGASSKDAPS